jgi:hypothetical protein
MSMDRVMSHVGRSVAKDSEEMWKILSEYEEWCLLGCYAMWLL